MVWAEISTHREAHCCLDVCEGAQVRGGRQGAALEAHQSLLHGADGHAWGKV